MTLSRIILSSGSPRRKDLLSRLVDSFEIASSAVEDEGSGLMPSENLPRINLPEGFPALDEGDPQLWAWRKAFDIATSELYRTQNCLVLGADTVVVSHERVLGKPLNSADAREILRLLRGTDHYVVTGFALLVNQKGQTSTVHLGHDTTRVVMRTFSDSELTGYVATGEPLDKAGAYALQGDGGKLVEAIDGCATNVVGLPLCRVRRMLKGIGADLLPRPEDGYCGFCPFQDGAIR